MLSGSLARRDERQLDEIAALRVEERRAIEELTARLSSTLITPVNHEDLMMLSAWTRRVRREVTLATERVHGWGSTTTSDLDAVANGTRRTCELLVARVEGLRRGKRAAAPDDVRRAATSAKAIARTAVVRVLSGNTDPIGALQQYDFLRFLSQANEAAKQAANWIDYTIVRNG